MALQETLERIQETEGKLAIFKDLLINNLHE